MALQGMPGGYIFRPLTSVRLSLKTLPVSNYQEPHQLRLGSFVVCNRANGRPFRAAIWASIAAPRQWRSVVLRIWSFGLLAGSLALIAAPEAQSQDYRVRTRVYQESTAGTKNRQAVGGSTSIFHAGKVYDQIGGRMTIFEPAHDRFIILDESRNLRTVATFDELLSELHLVSKSAEKLVDSILRQDDPEARKHVGHIKFQLTPNFKESFDETSRRLSLSSPYLNYSVKCVAPEPSENEKVELYLQFTDWAARLNAVIMPSALLPAPRLELNESLRKRGLLPTEISLEFEKGPGALLCAEHSYQWKLDANDLRTIRHWDSALTEKKWKVVSFKDYVQQSKSESRTSGRPGSRKSTHEGARESTRTSESGFDKPAAHVAISRSRR
jgi:hypothetical protein